MYVIYVLHTCIETGYLPEDKYTIVHSLPDNCRTAKPLSGYSTATCFGVCTTDCDEANMLQEIQAQR